MKTVATVIVSSLVGFLGAFLAVPGRTPTSVPPAWFELPGRPLSVDGKPVENWAQANEALRQFTRSRTHVFDFKTGLPQEAPEAEGAGVRVTYMLADGGDDAGASAVRTVTVHPCLSQAAMFSRNGFEPFVRYEVERNDVVE